MVIAAAAAGRLLVTGPSALPQQLTAVLGFLTSLSGVLAFAFVIARGLLWSAPVLARLHVRTDDNPLGEISGIVGHLRRWSPREGAAQGLADWGLALWLAVTVSAALWWRPGITLWRQLPHDMREHIVRIAAILLIVGAPLIVLRRRRRARPSPTKTAARWRARSATWWRTQAIGLVTRLRHRPVGITILVGAATAAGWLSLPLLSDAGDWWIGNTDPTTRSWILAAAAGVASYIAFLATTATRPRRMVLLVIDDLDRCNSDRVVRLLETVHTVLRERSAPRWLRRWREPARFAVIVSASGHWVQNLSPTTKCSTAKHPTTPSTTSARTSSTRSSITPCWCRISARNRPKTSSTSSPGAATTRQRLGHHASSGPYRTASPPTPVIAADPPKTSPS